MTGGSLTAGRGALEVVRYGVIVVAVYLGWEMIKAPVIERAPPALALRLAPGSPELLQRSAEAEFAAGRPSRAESLAAASIARAPFNARAMRVWAQAVDSKGDPAAADEAMTLAGNWSLRDDPAHAWLMVHRLRQGNLSSSFAHADTLARRRADLNPRLFALFAEAVTRDPRGAIPLARIMADSPPWRSNFLAYLRDQKGGAVALGYLAIALERTATPLSDAELTEIYATWVREGRLDGLRQLRTELRRPPMANTLNDGDFSAAPDSLPFPFGWRLTLASGVEAMITDDDLKPGNQALRVSYNGFTSGIIADQMTYLSPGDYVLSYDQRSETENPIDSLSWAVVCAESGADVAAPPVVVGRADADVLEWGQRTVRFTIPATLCSAQWFRLQSKAGEQRRHIAIWYDNLKTKSGPPSE